MNKSITQVAKDFDIEPETAMIYYKEAKHRFNGGASKGLETRIEIARLIEDELWMLFEKQNIEGKSQLLTEEINSKSEEYLQFKVYE